MDHPTLWRIRVTLDDQPGSLAHPRGAGRHGPAQLPLAVAEMLEAQVVTDHLRLGPCDLYPGTEEGTTLRIPSPWSGLFVFSRPDEPFTPAETARATGSR